MDRAIHPDSWAVRLVRSVAATLTAGMLVAFLASGLGLLLSMVTDRDPAWVFRGAVELAGPLLLGTMFVGTLLGLAMAIPVHVSGRWIQPGNQDVRFTMGAAVSVVAGFGALSMGSDMGMPLFIAALLVATGLGGLFFNALFERWAWVEPCAS